MSFLDRLYNQMGKMRRFVPVLVLLLVATVNATTSTLSSAGKPDLAITGLDTLPNPPVAGQAYDVYVWVRNIGDASFNGNIWIEAGSTGLLRTQEIDGERLASGEEKKFLVPEVPPFPDSGKKTISVRVSSPGISADSNDVYKKDVVVLAGSAGENSGGSQAGAGTPATGIGEKLKNYMENQNAEPNFSSIIIILIIVVIVIGIIAAVYMLKKRPAQPQQPQMVLTDTVEVELDSLRKEKEELEEAINIAKIKFYKRQMDEDSYKEIVKDHQEKLTRIEAKMASIEKRVLRLEQAKSAKD